MAHRPTLHLAHSNAPVPSAAADAVLVGVNHRTAPARLRDRLFVAPDEQPQALARLREYGLTKALVLATCDRTEIWAAEAAPETANAAARALFAERGTAPEELAGALYVLTGPEAVRHAMRVAAALDSQVVGEPQILGQVKEAQRRADAAGNGGGGLTVLLDAVYQAAKRVRSETRLAERPVTLAAAALRVARDIHGALARCRLLLVGDGEMGESLARQFRTAGIASLTVTAPSDPRAEALAEALDCHFAPFATLDAALPRADIVIAASTGRELILTEARVRAAYRARRRRPMFLVDAAVPGDVAPEVEAIDGVFRYDLADLEQSALDGNRARLEAAEKAERVVAEEAARFLAARQARAAGDGIVALRTEFEAARRAVLDTVRGDGAEEATRLLINRLLHAPSTTLRTLASDPAERAAAEAWLRRLFGPEGESVGDGHDAPGRDGDGR